MWKATIEPLASESAVKFRLLSDGPVAYSEVIELWRSDERFRRFYIEVLREAPFDAYRWETPPVTKGTLDREFEFVLIDCPSLARDIDLESFGEFFAAAQPNEMAITFYNLGRDAKLVVPCPLAHNRSSELSHFAHLASFVREGDPEQIDVFWQLVGKAMRKRVSKKPVWLNTAGMGVAWLHVRLDETPKYYAHAPYREEGPR